MRIRWRSFPEFFISNPWIEDATNWERISEIWSELKDRIEPRIQSIPQRSVRGKYSQMARHTYRDIITALRNDGVIKPAIKLLELDHTASAGWAVAVALPDIG